MAVLATWPGVLFEGIVDSDHSIHTAKTKMFIDSLSHFSAPFQWTNKIYTGYPAHIHYAWGAYLLPAFVSVFTWPWVSIGEAYGFSLLLFYAFFGIAFYRLSHLILPWPSAVAAAFLIMSSRGTWLVGGFEWYMEVGVWPSAFALALLVYSYVKWLEYRKSGLKIDIYLAGWCLGWAFLSHPITFLFCPLVFVAELTDLLRKESRKQLRKRLKKSMPQVLGALFLAALISIGWVIVFALHRNTAEKKGFVWVTIAEIFQRYKLLPNEWLFVSYLGLAALVLGLFSRNSLMRKISLLFFMLTFIASKNFSDLLPQNVQKKIEFARFMTFAYPLLYIALVYLLTQVLEKVEVFLSKKISGGHKILKKSSSLIFLLALAFSLNKFFDLKSFTRKSDLSAKYLSIFPALNELNEVKDWLSGLPHFPDQMARVAYATSPGGDHVLSSLTFEQPFPLIKIGNSPATSFLGIHNSIAEPVLRANNVRWLLTDHDVEAPSFKKLRDFGTVRAYEFLSWQSHPYTFFEDNFSVHPDRQSKLSLISLNDESVVIKIPDSTAGLLVVHFTDFPFWHLSKDGVEIPIKSRDQNFDWSDLEKKNGLEFPRPDAMTFMAFQVTSGEYHLKYVQPFWLSFVFFLSLLVLIVSGLSIFAFKLEGGKHFKKSTS